ncbi:MAG: YciI family protein [Candidatus Dormiibacterota bacterium]
MKYLLLMAADDGIDLTPEAADVAMEATRSWVKEMSARGVHLDGDRLRPATEARTLRMRGDELLVTDGRFAETREQIAGYDILECRDIEEAIRVAARHPFARFGTIEVRPFWPLPL